MSKELFKDFDEVSAKQWKQNIQASLKGADYNDTLVWQSFEGIHVKPFYHEDDFNALFQPIPGHPKNWEIAQSIFIADETIAKNLAKDALNRGAQAILFKAETPFEIEKVFKDFPLTDVTIFFQFQFLDEKFIRSLQKFFSSTEATVHYTIDIVGNLASTGNWYHDLKKDHAILDTILKDQTTNSSSQLIGVDATTYQNAGATCVQQLAYALAHANEYLNHIASDKKSDVLSSPQFTFKVAVGSNYFFEIAKIRTLRLLYATLAAEYGVTETCHILAMPSKRNKTLYDYNVNMLRSTTECMSAILGGADTICNLPYDSLYHKSNEFAERIARNQLLILREESYFNAVSNAADGSYYIESLTQELADKGLKLFKSIEKGGGFLQQLKAGTIQKKIKESATKEQQLFDDGTLKLVGTNYHIDKENKMNSELDLYPFVKKNPRKTLIEPIIEQRIAEKIEKERLENE